MARRLDLFLFVLLLGGALPAAATPSDLLSGRTSPGEHATANAQQPAAVAAAPNSLDSWMRGERVSDGDAVSLAVELVMDWSRPLAGAVRKRNMLATLLDANLTFDLNRLVGLPGATLFADGYLQRGREASGDVGDFQGFSNIDSENRTQIAELWIEQFLLGERLRIKIGKVDANSEFAFVDAAADFIHSSAGVSPTILMPVYPDPAMSVNVFAYPTDSLYVGAAIYDGAYEGAGIPTGRRGPRTFFSNSKSDAYFLIGEVGWSWESAPVGGAGRLAAGPWYHTDRLDDLDGVGTQRGSLGFYVLAEHQMWSESASDAAGEQGLKAFIQYGYADEDVSEAVHHVGVGAVWSGLVPGRDADVLGLMVSWVDLSNEAAGAFPNNETAVELFYSVPVTGFFTLKGDLQFIDNPSGVSGNDTWVGTLRTEISF